MKGWRRSMEDAFVTLSDPEQSGLEDRALFAVFDGHGGKEVALFCERHFPEQVKAFLGEGLSWQEMFAQVYDAMDDLLRMPESESELRLLRNCSTSFSDSDNSSSMECRCPTKSYVDELSRHKEQVRASRHAAHSVGATGLAVLLTPETAVCANAGDSRAVLCRGGVPVELSFEHKPSVPEERRRIEEAGASLVESSASSPDREPRINGSLNVSRGFGDFKHKSQAALPRDRQAVICTPEVKSIDLSPQDEFIVLACDGVWEVKSSSEVCDFVRRRLPFLDLEEIVEELLDDCLAQTASSHLGCDNMTALWFLSLGKKARDPAAQAGGSSPVLAEERLVLASVTIYAVTCTGSFLIWCSDAIAEVSPLPSIFQAEGFRCSAISLTSFLRRVLTSLKRGQKPASADLGLGILILLLQLSVAEVQASSIQAIKLVCMLVAADHLAPPAILVSYPKVSDLVHGFPSLLLLGVLLQDIDDAVEIVGSDSVVSQA
eukprot:CAMPEP_0170579104 /NCGR_PEP_ID=MMETSP0224-20130122/5811_1 /TAXON_ID=285029 /ORGANISM="Togula jolla, Strain CCCM 725" /LENGTH=489 /DNA_ID=CAMNT_0010902117 /DNA_START=66 /DNA_END=1537 /DNA_ORIENTATION=+